MNRPCPLMYVDLTSILSNILSQFYSDKIGKSTLLICMVFDNFGAFEKYFCPNEL